MKLHAGWGRGLKALALVALFAAGAACEKPPPAPELRVGPPGDAEKCTLGPGKPEFTIYDPFAFVLEMHRPFGGDTVTIRSVRFFDDGVSRITMMEKPIRVVPEHESLCVVDPEVKGALFFGKEVGEMMLEALQNGEIVAEAHFTVRPVPSTPVEEPAATDAPKAPAAK